MTTADLIIIGAGPGGYRAAEYAAKAGLAVIIVENRQLGGTCLNAGCIPTKTLARNAEVADTLRDAARFGFSPVDVRFDLGQAIARKDEVVRQLRSGIATLLAQPGITLVQGSASFTDDHTVEVAILVQRDVDDEEDEEDDGDYTVDVVVEMFTAPHIIIATGSSPRSLRLDEADRDTICYSDELLAIRTLPRRLCIVGAGVIGMEFASIFGSFGSEVTVVEYLKECLPTLDSDVAKRLRKSLEKRGVRFEMQTAVKAIRRGQVVCEKKGKELVFETDRALVAVGRVANTEGLNLEAAGVECSPKGIAVDENMQTNVAGIYAIGDVNGRQMLAHAATMQGFRAVNHILGRPDTIDFNIMPAAIFTRPEAGCVGLSEDACKEQGLDYTCRRTFYRANGKAQAMDDVDGMVKLMADKATGRILGCHASGAHSADIIQEVSVLMCSHVTLTQLRDMTHIHPTLGEMVQNLALNLGGCIV